MKRLIALLMVLVMVFSLAACGSDESEDPANNEANVSDTQEPGSEDNDENEEADKDAEENADKDQKEDVKQEADKNESTKDEGQQDQGSTSATVAQTLSAEFKSIAGGSSAQAIADKLLQNPVILFQGGTAPVTPGLLTGFGNAEITGFSEGVMFAPGIGTIPFIGYIFVLEEGTDASEFVSTLKSNADPRWNICTSAEETVVSAVGNKVFFVMSPKSFEQ
ncbi:MAG: hypothetical protein IJC41_04110 [Firmicutes bacterium]|nr:hypothetical protein [Bacillota bacterium]